MRSTGHVGQTGRRRSLSARWQSGPAVNKDETTGEDTRPLMVRNEARQEASRGISSHPAEQTGPSSEDYAAKLHRFVSSKHSGSGSTGGSQWRWGWRLRCTRKERERGGGAQWEVKHNRIFHWLKCGLTRPPCPRASWDLRGILEDCSYVLWTPTGQCVGTVSRERVGRG